MTDTPPKEIVLHGKTLQVFITVQTAMGTEANRKLHFQKDDVRGTHYRIRSSILLTQPEKTKLLAALTEAITCERVTVETARWTKAWLTSAKGTVIRLYL